MFHSAHGIRFKLVSNWEQSMLYAKSLQVLHRKTYVYGFSVGYGAIEIDDKIFTSI